MHPLNNVRFIYYYAKRQQMYKFKYVIYMYS